MQKSIKSIAWNVKEEEYRKDPAYSYSQLAKFEREGWRNLSTLFDRVESPSLTFGSAVDVLTLPVEGEKSFDDLFMVCDFPVISDTLITITRDLHGKFGQTHKNLSDIEDKDISEAAVRNNYYVNDRYAAFRVKTIKEQCGEYYNLLTLAGDKTILSTEEFTMVQSCVNELKTNPYTKNWLVNNPFDNDMEVVYQLKFKGDYKGINVRCMFDALVVNHKEKVIYPVDLKTSGHYEEDFEQSFFQWKYYIQARLYTEILKQNIAKDPYFKDFNVQSYRFIVINKKSQSPNVWIYSGNHVSTDILYKGEHYRDWRPILSDLDWYLKHPDTKYSRGVLTSQGEMIIGSYEDL